jgi:predicted ATP-dependent endonuclease of OLD family
VSQGWTVVITTHSPEFVTFSENQQIVRLHRIGRSIAAGVHLTTSTSQEAKFQEKVDQYGNHEIVLAARAIFCEGKDDAFAIRHGLAKLGTDIDARAVSVLDVGSCSTIPAYCDMAGKLKIPWCALTDEDLTTGWIGKTRHRPGSYEDRRQENRDGYFRYLARQP